MTLAICCLLTLFCSAAGRNAKGIYSPLTSSGLVRTVFFDDQDTIPRNQDTLPRNITKPARGILNRTRDTSIVNDTTITPRVDSFSLRISKDTLDAPVHYEAEDSAVVWIDSKKIILYGKTRTTYQDVVLTAPMVELDQQTNLLTAYSDRDSLDQVLTRARFEQGEQKFESDRIQFNFKTQRGVTENTFTQQDEMFVFGETVKKVNESTVYIQGGRFTTCDLDEPHFSFRANKLKIINNKVAVSGPMHPEFENVPVPIWLPFGYYPLTRGRHSGILTPRFTATENMGIGLEDLGYYKVLSEYFDLMLVMDLYSYGSWRADLTPSYRKRYRYSGRMNISVQDIRENFRADPDFSQQTGFMFNWTHSIDHRARPGINFSTNVNVGSNKYNRYVTNNPNQNFQNNLTSSINYSKTTKRYNLTLAGNHQQNSVTRQVNVTLPEMGFSLNNIYPFENKTAPTGRFYEKVSIGYNSNLTNRFAFIDTSFGFGEVVDGLEWGAAHRFPLQMALNPIGPFIISPGINYEQQWIGRKTFRALDTITNRLKETNTQTGLYVAHHASFSLSVNTAVYGTFQFKKSKVTALRHVLRPSVSFAYTPNMAKDYHVLYADTLGNTNYYNLYSERNRYTGYTNQRFGGISFGIDNSLQMKMRSSKDTTTATRKVSIIDRFDIRSGYNFLLDSFRLQDFAWNLSTSITDKLNLNMYARMSPYEFDNFTGRRIDMLAIREGRIGYFTDGGISMSTQFRSKPRDASKPAQPTPRHNQLTDPSLMNDQQMMQEYMRRNPSEFVDFNIPFEMSLDFALNFNRTKRLDAPGFRMDYNSSVNFTNSFSLTPKWKFSSNGMFDIKTHRLQTFSVAINRELHCWQMSIGVTPVGLWRSFYINISPRSSILQDLKVNRTRTFTNF